MPRRESTSHSRRSRPGYALLAHRQALLAHLRLWLGYVVRYYEDGPTYAWTMARRIGGCSTDQAARSAAEQALAEGR
jgi:hypothetical protein